MTHEYSHMQAFDLGDLIRAGEHATESSDRPLYQEILRSSTLSVGVYTLPAGSVDPQQPHTEDEVYYVVDGRGSIRVGNEDRAVGPGTIVFVPERVEHRFHTIDEELSVLVFFAPPEYSRTESGSGGA